MLRKPELFISQFMQRKQKNILDPPMLGKRWGKEEDPVKPPRTGGPYLSSDSDVQYVPWTPVQTYLSDEDDGGNQDGTYDVNNYPANAPANAAANDPIYISSSTEDEPVPSSPLAPPPPVPSDPVRTDPVRIDPIYISSESETQPETHQENQHETQQEPKTTERKGQIPKKGAEANEVMETVGIENTFSKRTDSSEYEFPESDLAILPPQRTRKRKYNLTDSEDFLYHDIYEDATRRRMIVLNYVWFDNKKMFELSEQPIYTIRTYRKYPDCTLIAKQSNDSMTIHLDGNIYAMYSLRVCKYDDADYIKKRFKGFEDLGLPEGYFIVYYVAFYENFNDMWQTDTHYIWRFLGHPANTYISVVELFTSHLDKGKANIMNDLVKAYNKLAEGVKKKFKNSFITESSD